MEAEAKALVGPSGWALQQLGLWRPPAAAPAGPRLLAAFFVVATDVLVSAGSVAQLVFDIPTDPETLRDVFFTATCAFAWALRTVLFMQQGSRLERLVMTLLDTRKRYAEEVPGTRSSYDRGASVIFYAWQVLPLFSVSLWALGPVTGAPLAAAAGNSTVAERREPLVLWLPFDTQPSPTYELVFAMQVVGVVAVSEVSILLDIFLVSLMMHVTAEIAVLDKNVSSIRLSRLNGHRSLSDQRGDAAAVGRERDRSGGQSTDADLSDEWSTAATQTFTDSTLLASQDIDAAKRRLYVCLKRNIQHHQIIMSCVNELEQAMSTSTYIILLANALTICLHAFGFVELFQGGWKGPAVVKRLLACPIYMGQTALFCLIGQSLTDRSERLLDSAFSCGWPAADRRFCSALLIFMQQASQPLTIRVGKIVTLSRNSFLQVMNVSYTIFNMMLNTQ